MECRSRFVNLLKSKEAREQVVLIVDGPVAGKAEALLQPKHGFEPRDRSTRRPERSEAADLRHVLLHAKMVALNALLEMLGYIVNRIRTKVPVIDGRLDR